MIIACYMRKPVLTSILVTLTAQEQAATMIIDEIVLRRFTDDPADAWTTETREWVPTELNTVIQAATETEVSTLLLDGNPIAVVFSEVDDILLDVALQYLVRRGITGTLSMQPGASSSIKADIDAAPHTEP